MLVVSLVFLAPASATIITVEVTGVVDSVATDGGLALDGSVIVGSVMTGFCIYDTDTPDEDPSEDKGKYALLSISMNIGNYTFTHDPMSTDSALFNVGYDNWWIYRVDSASPRFDGTLYIDDSPKGYDDIAWDYTYLKLMKVGSQEYTTTDALPDSLPDFSVFDMDREFRVCFYEPSAPDRGYFDINGEVTTLVPEPATLLLLGLGGLALLRRRKG